MARLFQRRKRGFEAFGVLNAGAFYIIGHLAHQPAERFSRADLDKDRCAVAHHLINGALPQNRAFQPEAAKAFWDRRRAWRLRWHTARCAGRKMNKIADNRITLRSLRP
jgi:hypothetical protein